MSKVLQEFCMQCHNTLITCNDNESVVAKKYLLDRKITEDTIKIHNIGYCFEKQILPDLTWEGAGKSDDGEDKKISMYRNYIRGRIVVPIHSEFGKVIAFATRKPTYEKGNCWWNTPFSKGNNLFLLQKSKKKIFEDNKVYVVEGYMDALLAYQFGLKNVVCVMGTALTLRHISLIARYCNNVCLCFDVDENNSGQKATAISLSLLKKFDLCDKLSIIQDLPVQEDPASYIGKYGLESFLSKEVEVTDKKIQEMVKDLAIKKMEKERMYAR